MLDEDGHLTNKVKEKEFNAFVLPQFLILKIDLGFPGSLHFSWSSEDHNWTSINLSLKWPLKL